MEAIKMIKPCEYCQATGDWQGKIGMKYADFKSQENKCYHCNGTGDLAESFTDNCKYCGKPCNGYCCESCYNEFEESSSYEVEEEEVMEV